METLVKNHRRPVWHRPVQLCRGRPQVTERRTQKAGPDHRVLLRIGCRVLGNCGNQLLRTHAGPEGGGKDVGDGFADVHVGVDKARQHEFPVEVCLPGGVYEVAPT